MAYILSGILKSITGSFRRGFTAAVPDAPVCVGFGMLALAPLGFEFVQPV